MELSATDQQPSFERFTGFAQCSARFWTGMAYWAMRAHDASLGFFQQAGARAGTHSFVPCMANILHAIALVPRACRH